MPCHETKGYSEREDGSIERVYVVYNVADADQAKDYAFAKAPPTLVKNNIITHTRGDTPNVQQFGHELYEVVFKYEPIQVGDVQGGPDQITLRLDGILSFEASGKSLHITQAIGQTAYGGDGSDLEKEKVIGASGDSVDGVDVTVPNLRFTITKRPPALVFQTPLKTGQYIKDMARLTGVVNGTPYTLRGWLVAESLKGYAYAEVPFEPGELMFLGASPTSDGLFKYEFDASENRENIILREQQPSDANGDPVPELKIPLKRGHEYLWMLYKQKELAKPRVKVPVPNVAFVSTVAYNTNFFNFLGF